jgi:hypothetical protein
MGQRRAILGAAKDIGVAAAFYENGALTGEHATSRRARRHFGSTRLRHTMRPLLMALTTLCEARGVESSELRGWDTC